MENPDYYNPNLETALPKWIGKFVDFPPLQNNQAMYNCINYPLSFPGTTPSLISLDNQVFRPDLSRANLYNYCFYQENICPPQD